MTIDPVIAWSFLAVGIFGLSFALLLARRPIRMLRAGGKAQGTVTGNDEQMVSGSRGPARKYFFPQVAYTTEKGEQISFKSVIGRGIPTPPGTVVPVLYDSDKPHEAILASFAAMWLFPILTSVFTLPFLAVGLIGVLK